MASRIHTYSSDNGVLTHNVTNGDDYAGEITVTGETVPLIGWPTPAMRKAVAGNGDSYCWYVGTNEAGEIIRTR